MEDGPRDDSRPSAPVPGRVLGKVIKGSEVVDQIEVVETDRRDKPVKPVIIESATLID